MRNQIAVVAGVFADIEKGYQLSAEDYSDARQAAKLMTEAMNALRDMGSAQCFRPERLRLSDLLNEAVATGLDCGAKLCLTADIDPSPRERDLDARLILAALRGLGRYVLMRKDRLPSQSQAVELKLCSSSEGQESNGGAMEMAELLTLSFCPGESRDFSHFSKVRSLGELALSDNSIESLGLLFADEAFRLHGGKSEFAFAQPERMEFKFCFPSCLDT